MDSVEFPLTANYIFKKKKKKKKKKNTTYQTLVPSLTSLKCIRAPPVNTKKFLLKTPPYYTKKKIKKPLNS